jgi:hypothetical protein
MENLPEALTFPHFIQWAFYGLITFFAFDLKTTMKELKDSALALNIKLATVLERTESHKEKLEDHSDRLLQLEREKLK